MEGLFVEMVILNSPFQDIRRASQNSQKVTPRLFQPGFKWLDPTYF